VSASNFDCANPDCHYNLGSVRTTAKGRIFRHPPEVDVRNYLGDGYARVVCPKCGKVRIFRGGVVEIKREKVPA
jgi:hypothetical protein